jgi:hypothetical protein
MQLIYPTERVRDFAKRHGSADAAWQATFGPNDRDSLDWSSQVLWLAQIERGTHENLDFLADHEAKVGIVDGLWTRKQAEFREMHSRWAAELAAVQVEAA